MQVENLTFREYLALEDPSLTNYYLRYGTLEPEDIFEVGDFVDMPFAFVKTIQHAATYSAQGLTWDVFFKMLHEYKGLDLEVMADISIYELQKGRKYFISQVDVINQMEVDYLGHRPTPEEKQAGIDRFSSYGHFLQLDKLAAGNILLYKDIEKLKYSFCFTKLKLEKDRDEFQENHNQIMRDKVK